MSFDFDSYMGDMGLKSGSRVERADSGGPLQADVFGGSKPSTAGSGAGGKKPRSITIDTGAPQVKPISREGSKERSGSMNNVSTGTGNGAPPPHDPNDPRFQLKSKMSPVYDYSWKDLVGSKTGIQTLREITRLQNEKRVMAKARI